MALTGGGDKQYCPRPYSGEPCGTEMKLLNMADGTEWDFNWTHCFYFCKRCNRSLMVSRRMEVIEDPEERI